MFAAAIVAIFVAGVWLVRRRFRAMAEPGQPEQVGMHGALVAHRH